MNKAELSLVVGLLFLILGKITAGGLGVFYLVLGIAAVLYFVGIEALAAWMKYQQKNKPPFAMNAQIYFETQEERTAFTDKLNGLIQEVRREKDATNGLNTEQLAEVGLDADGQPVVIPENSRIHKHSSTRPNKRSQVVSMYKRGVSIQQIQKSFGHKNTSTIYRYLRDAKVRLRG